MREMGTCWQHTGKQRGPCRAEGGLGSIALGGTGTQTCQDSLRELSRRAVEVCFYRKLVRYHSEHEGNALKCQYRDLPCTGARVRQRNYRVKRN